MSEQPAIGSLAEELRALAGVLVDQPGGADRLLESIRDSLGAQGGEDDEPAVEQIEIS